MKKENVVILVVITFIVGFVAGGVSGIKFYAGHGAPAARQAQPADEAGPAEAGGPGVSASDIERLEAQVRAEPRNFDALVQLGNLYFDSNQYKQAIDVYTKALALDPKNPDVRTDLGVMYRATKDYDGAVREFREAARLDPKHKNSRFNLGIVLQQDKKDIPGAIAAWEDFLRVEPTGGQADMARAELKQLKELSK